MYRAKRFGNILTAGVVICLLFMPVSGHSTGDVDLDGVYNSVADFATFNAYFRFGLSVFGPWPAESIGETDFNCDGLTLSVADMVTLWRVILAEEEPCYGPLPPNSGGVTTASVNPDAYKVRLDNLVMPGTDTGWMEIVMTQGTGLFSGAQFHIEYEADMLQLLDVQPGPDFAEWGIVSYNQSVADNMADVKLGMFAFDMENMLELSMPVLPTVLMRLKFVIVEDVDFVRPVTFVWEECADNAIAVVQEPVIPLGAIPEFLAVSNFVFDGYGNFITGINYRDGGAGDDCLAGGLWNVPQRFIDFYGGLIDRRISCCIGTRGNVNNDPSNSIDISDLIYLVRYLFDNGATPTCEESADIDGSGSIDISDLTYMVQFFFQGGVPPLPCP